MRARVANGLHPYRSCNCTGLRPSEIQAPRSDHVRIHSQPNLGETSASDWSAFAVLMLIASSPSVVGCAAGCAFCACLNWASALARSFECWAKVVSLFSSADTAHLRGSAPILRVANISELFWSLDKPPLAELPFFVGR
jgi:hypothetical protein